jgi:L-2-amino-thiazoline-4-carboxylic acid hydrolase
MTALIPQETKPPPSWARKGIRIGRPAVRVAAKRAMVGRNRSRTDPTAGRFTARQVSGFVADTFVRFDRHAPGLPSEPTAGSRQNVMLAALTLSFLEALEGSGVERRYAIELTGDTCWRFYRHWGQLTGSLAKLLTRDPVGRLRLNVNAFLSFPFGRPGYQFDDVSEPTGRSLDMRRCPVADYLGKHGAADLCAGSWCNLDYALAEMWGAGLQRSGTLVGGASCCDFRFRVSASPDVAPAERPAQRLPMLAR